MKTVYFVRHGQTEGNQKSVYQHSDISLSEKGREQAAMVAERFTRISIDALVASDFERAQETARAIAAKTGQTIITEPLFQEINRPAAIQGKAFTDPEALEIRQFTDEHFADHKKHSDEENFKDLSDRGLRALSYLEQRTEKSLAVVTHGSYLHMLIALMIFNKDLTPDEFLKFENAFHMSNTGITKCTFDNSWLVLSWNDDAHLG